MKRLAFLPTIAFAAIACGSFLAEPVNESSADAGDTPDAAVPSDAIAGDVDVDADGPVSQRPLAPPPMCPHDNCDDEGDSCADEDCDDSQSTDFEKVGGILANGTCKVATSTGTSTFLRRTLVRTMPRTNVVLSAEILAILPGDGVIMSIGTTGGVNGVRVVVTRRGTDLELCELDGVLAPKCAAPLPFMPPTSVNLWGVVTSDDPPRATFALSTDQCSAERTIELGKLFAQGDIVGSAGCVDPESNSCSIEIDDAVLLLRPE